MRLSRRAALVTGGAQRLGRAIALALAGEGASIALHYGTSAGAARQTAAEIAALGVEVETFQADLADPSHIAGLIDAVAARFGRLDVLVNSAASFRKQTFGDISADDWDRVMAVNLRAPFLLSQAAARLMRSGERDAPALIANIADLSGIHPWAGYAHHAVSKAGLIHLTKIAARELAPEIRVNAVVPGPVLPPPGVDEASPEWQQIAGRTPLGRTGEPDDIARAVVFLAQSDFITGAILPVDGGEGLLGPIGH